MNPDHSVVRCEEYVDTDARSAGLDWWMKAGHGMVRGKYYHGYCYHGYSGP